MAAITPVNGRVAFLASHSPHTYWVLDSTNLGTNYGDDTSGNDDNTAVATGDISTALAYEGMATQNDPPQSGWFDIYTVTDAAALVYIPSGLTTGTVYGLWHNGGGTNAQSGMLRATATGVEIAIVHNTGGTDQDNMVYEIPTADLDGWHCIGWQFSSEGGAQGDMGLWVNGVKVADGTRAFQLAYGSGNPDFGASAGDEPLSASGISPYGADANWTAAGSINGSGILIANFAADNPGQTNSAPAGAGDTFHSDYFTAHTAAAAPVVTDAGGDEDFRDGDAVTVTGSTFGATQGVGLVEIGDGPDHGTATLVTQPVTSWADGSIDITANLGTLTPGAGLYLFVTDNASATSTGLAVTVRRAIAFVLSASPNIAPGGTDPTTARLTPPAGKTTGDHDPGQRSDDTSPTPSTTTDALGYTEREWALEATALATLGGVYEFRVVRSDGSPLDTYASTPQWTIGSGTAPNEATGTAPADATSAATTSRPSDTTGSGPAEATSVGTTSRPSDATGTAPAEAASSGTTSRPSDAAGTASAEATSSGTTSAPPVAPPEITGTAPAEASSAGTAGRASQATGIAVAEATSAGTTSAPGVTPNEVTGTAPARASSTATSARPSDVTGTASAEATSTGAAAQTPASIGTAPTSATSTGTTARSSDAAGTALAQATSTAVAARASEIAGTAPTAATSTGAASAPGNANVTGTSPTRATSTGATSRPSDATGTGQADAASSGTAARPSEITGSADAQATSTGTTVAPSVAPATVTGTAPARATSAAVAARESAAMGVAPVVATSSGSVGPSVAALILSARSRPAVVLTSTTPASAALTSTTTAGVVLTSTP